MRMEKGFISVNTKLPELFEKVEVLTIYGEKCIAWRPYKHNSLFFMRDGRSIGYDGNFWAGAVIGWKPVKGMVK